MVLTEWDVLARLDYRFPVTAEQGGTDWGVRIAEGLLSVDDAFEFLDALRVAIGQARHLQAHPRADQEQLEVRGQATVDAARVRRTGRLAAKRACVDRHPAGKRMGR